MAGGWTRAGDDRAELSRTDRGRQRHRATIGRRRRFRRQPGACGRRSVVYAGPTDRVASNPLFLNDLTSFPVNISWALLADLSSCYAGWETAQVYVDLPRAQVRALDDRFIRVFAGEGSAADIRALAVDDGCRVAVVTDADGAWRRDPFAASPFYQLAERADGWRIYVRR